MAVAAAVTAVAGGIYSGVQTASAARKASHMTSPPPANYNTYDEDGNLTGSQTWNAETNTYEYRPGALTEAQKAEKAQRDELRTKYLGKLNDTTLEEQMASYADYAEKLVSTSYTETKQASEEEMNARGLTGSRAYADRLAAVDKAKTETVLNTERELATADRSHWMNVLGYLDAGANADAAKALESQRTAEAGAAGASATTMAGFQQKQQAEFAKIQAQSQLGTNLMNTATGLMFLYGYKGGGGGIGGSSPSAPGSGRTFDPSRSSPHYRM